MAFADILKGYVLPIAAIFAAAWVVHRLAGRFVAAFSVVARLAPQRLRMREERRRTLQDLLSSMISFLAFLVAILLSLSFFVDANTLIWMVGLFSAAFGLGARPLISDWLTGIGFIFEDTFDVGEKVEILGIEGVIEAINLRTTLLRAPTGELYVMPNGEIRVIRNFSRGAFSTTKIRLKVATADLQTAISLLEALGEDAVLRLPDMLEPWQVLTSGEFGQQVELTLVVKARFGRAADLRSQILTMVHQRLAEAGIMLVN